MENKITESISALAVTDLTFRYPECDRAAVDGISFNIARGELAVLCGSTGSGKSTLLRLIKHRLAPRGETAGEILIGGECVEDTAPEHIGFVMQSTEEQIVTDKVYSELAFGLENLGLDRDTMARRIAEMASYFGIESWFDRDVSTLSGGQKQLLNLAAVMVTDPKLLILDEPTSQLDPIATTDFLATLRRLNSDFGLTVIIAEHRLEEIIPYCDRLMVMEDGRLIANGAPSDVIAAMDSDATLLSAMPAAARLWRGLGSRGKCPLTVREGRQYIEANYGNKTRSLSQSSIGDESSKNSKKAALEFRGAYFRYERALPDVLRGLDLTVYENEIFCILGGNGSGKTTALSCAAGIRKLYSGSVRVFGKRVKDYGQSLYRQCLTLLPQDVESVFLCNTVREELADAGAKVDELPFDLSAHMDKHPYDLSGGEKQLVALAKVLATKPKILLMDEPTKGLDCEKKQQLASLIKQLKADGLTLVIVTHDIEFSAMCADRCALFFHGGVASVADVRDFYSKNSFYTTAAARMTRGYYDGVLTVDDAMQLCRANDGGEEC